MTTQIVLRFMRQRISIFIILTFCTSLFSAPFAPAEAAYLPLSARSFVVLDAQTQKILYSKSPHSKCAPASTAKLLSAMVILDHLDPDEVVRVPHYATQVQPSKIRIASGEQFYVRDLMKAMLLCSANDAAYALAIRSTGSVRSFSSRMNAKARKLGAKNSHFISPAGLPASGQYSTAYDLARIMAAAQRYPLILQNMKQRGATIRSLNGRTFYLKNTNKMLWDTGSREIIGKTGYTRAARHCFAGRIRIGGKQMLVGLMGAPRRANLWSDLKKMAAFPPSIGGPGKKNTKDPILVNRQLNSRKKVKQIQAALKRAGYFKGPVNGNFGPMTLAATQKFQRAKGLDADGIVGVKTWTKLKAYL